MLALISPAKTLDFSPKTGNFTLPQMLTQTQTLVDNLSQKSASDIGQLMKLSEKLGNLNYQRYQNFSKEFTTENAKAAIFAFKGDVYTGLDVDSFDADDIEFAGNSMRMLSGLYGLLRPLDLIQPYRLEMGTRLPVESSKNLYEFWGDTISKEINKVETDVVINLASQEYFKAVDTQALRARIIDIVFKENKGGVYKVIGIHAKRARGRMINFIVKNRITEPQQLQQFNLDEYSFNQELSSENSWVWTR